jgi:hypothetical protein
VPLEPAPGLLEPVPPPVPGIERPVLAVQAGSVLPGGQGMVLPLTSELDDPLPMRPELPEPDAEPPE